MPDADRTGAEACKPPAAIKSNERKTRPVKGTGKKFGGAGNSVVPVAVGTAGRPDLLGAVTLVLEAASSPSGRGQSAVDAVLVLVVADPVDLGVMLDDRASGVDEDDLVPLVLPVRSDPVGVQDLEVLIALLGPLLGDGLEGFADDELFLSLPVLMCLLR